MSKPLLSIIVPTMPGRENCLSRLLWHLEHQRASKVPEVIVVDGDGPMGDKVRKGYERARGKFSVVVDDDDWLASDYMHRVSALAKLDVAAIGYDVVHLLGGSYVGTYASHKGGSLPPWFTVDRCICPKVPVLTDLCREVGFGNAYEADREWCDRMRLLLADRLCVYTPTPLYFYDDHPGGGFGGPRPDPGLWPHSPDRVRRLTLEPT